MLMQDRIAHVNKAVRARRMIAGLAATLVVAGCSAAPQAATGTPSTTPTAAPTSGSKPTTTAQPASASWPTYHGDNARTGVATMPPVGTLRVAWHAGLDGAVYGQPLVVGETILAATENDTVYGLAAGTGAVLWSTHLGTPQPQSGLPCGDIDPLGITSTMAYDQATGLVFAVAETTGGAHTLYGLNATTGKVTVHVPIEPPKGTPLAHQQRSALTVWNGRVYVAYGGLFGDCGDYIGSVVSVTTSGTDPISYAIPTAREGGIWAPGGAIVTNGRLYYSAGNGESTSTYDDSDSVFALTPGTLQRTDLFAPATWQADNADDIDLGSAGPVALGQWIFVAGKRGAGYVLAPNHLGGVGGQVAQTTACRSYGGASVSGNVAYLPCPDGPIALTIGPNGAPKVLWQAAVPANGSPTIGGGVVWVPDYDIGVLYALDPATGHVRTKISIGALPHFASPSLAGGQVYVGTMNGVVAVAGA